MELLRCQVAKEQLDEGINLVGWIPHGQLQNRLLEADVLAFPSIREFGGGVVLEAMACGVVPIVVDYAGPGELVTDATGFRISMGSREQIVMDLRKAACGSLKFIRKYLFQCPLVRRDVLMNSSHGRRRLHRSFRFMSG